MVVRGEEEEGAGGKERSRGGAAGEKETGVERAVKSQEWSQWLGGRTELGRGAARVSPPAFGPRLGRDLFSRRRRRPPIRFRRSSDSPQLSSASPQPVLSQSSASCSIARRRCAPCRRFKNAEPGLGPPPCTHASLVRPPSIPLVHSYFSRSTRPRAPRSHSRQWARRISRRVSVVVARNDVVWKLLC